MLSSSGRKILNVSLVDSSTWSSANGSVGMVINFGLRTMVNFHILSRFNRTTRHEIQAASFQSFSRRHFSWSSSCVPLRISPQVQEAVHSGRPVVALESAIITHGMPYPHNIQTAMNVQAILREQGVTPATVGVIKGQLTVGLTDQEIETLGSSVQGKNNRSTKTIKVSRRDLPFALSRKLNGGTTVTGTIIGALKANIPIFVTGGLGGVHRGAELTFDVSADLRELGRSPIAVVSAGVKSILDIGKTLEYLETEGVCVCVLKKEVDGVDEQKIHSSKFPSFFTAESPFNAPYVVTNETEAANLVHSSLQFGLGSGILITLPIPKEYAASGEKIEEAIKIALSKAKEDKVTGKEMTPFLLQEINRLTSGESLKANTHLIEHNARVGGEIAVQLSRIRKEASDDPRDGDGDSTGGGQSCHHGDEPDLSAKVKTDKRNSNAAIHTNNFKLDSNLSSRGDCTSNKNFGDNSTHLHRQSKKGTSLFKCNGPSNSLESHTSTSTPKAEYETKDKDNHRHLVSSSGGRPVVIGGTSLDIILRVHEDEIVSDGRTHKATIKTVPGGVGRNIAEVLCKLGHDPLFISTIGDDLFGREILRLGSMSTRKLDFRGVLTLDSSRTAVYSALLNKGECVFGLGDMSVHDEISSEAIERHAAEIRHASIVLVDGNIPTETMTTIFRLCTQHSVPVFYEPTEVRKAKKIVSVPEEFRSCLRYISPNLRELISIIGGIRDEESEEEKEEEEKLSLTTKTMRKSHRIGIRDNLSWFVNNMSTSQNKDNEQHETGTVHWFQSSHSHLTQTQNGTEMILLSDLISRFFSLFSGLQIILLTNGSRGFYLIERKNGESFNVLQFAAPEISPKDLKSVSGAGDSLVGGFVSGLLCQLSILDCGAKGTLCAKKSLESTFNVPDSILL